MKEFNADLHIHTCLSPCAEIDMSPLAVVKRASETGIDIIAVTDHNSAENVLAAQRAAWNMDLTVLAGMEVSSSEEAHIIALFNKVETVIALQDIVYANMLPDENDEKMYGEQIVANEHDEVMGFNKRLLIGGTMLPAQDIINTIHSLGGLALASHIDKDAFSIISQLGFITEDMGFDALEMSPNMGRNTAEITFQMYNSYTWISSSDAHHPEDIGKRTISLFINEPTIEEIGLAFKNIDGRKVVWK
jgi:PHP family Zn ribbon phosphoesterase